MDLKYFVGKTQETTKLTSSEESKLLQARKVLIKTLEIEELYDQIIESHLSFKSELYQNSLRAISNSRVDYIANYEIRSSINRHIFNTLNFSKRYLDKHYHEQNDKCFASDLSANTNYKKEVEHQRKEISSSNIHYNLGCRLRNIVQHKTLPIRSYSSGITNGTNSRVSAHFNLPIEKQTLKDFGIKSSLLEKYGDLVDLHEVMDKYIFAVAQMHMLNRKLLVDTVQSAKVTFKELLQSVKDVSDNLSYGEEVYRGNCRLFSLNLDWFDVVTYLKSKHTYSIDYQLTSHNTYLIEQKKTR